MRICRKYPLIPQKYNENNKNIYGVMGISGSGGSGFVVCVVGVCGCSKVLNRLKIDRFFEEILFEQRGQHVQVWENR